MALLHIIDKQMQCAAPLKSMTKLVLI